MTDLLDELAARAAALRPVPPAHRVVVGIAGAPGASKSALAEALVARLSGTSDWADTQVAHVPMDGFHLADAELERLGLRDRKGAPETFDAGGYSALLRRILAGETVWAPGFERTVEQPIAQRLPVTEQTRLVVTEGNYLLLPEPAWRSARTCCTEVWFCHVAPDVRVPRLIARHVQFGKSPEAAREWVLRSDERNARLVEATAEFADLRIDLTDWTP